MKARDVFQRLRWGSRGKPRRHPLIAGVLILALVAQFGCASSGTDKRSASSLHFPVPRAAIQELGNVGVTSARFAPSFEYVVAVGSSGGFVMDEDDPSKGTVWGALKGAVKGFFAPLQLGAAGTPFVLPIIAVLMPVGLVAGAIEGAKKAEPAVKVEERTVQEATIRKMVTSQRIQDDLRDRVVGIGASMTPHIFEGMTDRGPSTRGDQPDYLSLSQEGIQAVLEVVVERVTLDAIEEIPDPKFRLVMTVNTRLIRVVDNVEFYLYANKRTYDSKSLRTLAEWVSDPEGFRNELNQAYTDIAEKIVKEVFLGTESN